MQNSASVYDDPSKLKTYEMIYNSTFGPSTNTSNGSLNAAKNRWPTQRRELHSNWKMKQINNKDCEIFRNRTTRNNDPTKYVADEIPLSLV